MASRLVRANAVTVNDVLDGHKLLEIDCVDRVYLTLSVPSLLVGGQVVSFLTAHERNPIPSPTLLEQRGLAFCRAVHSFAEANDIPALSFADKRDKGRLGCWPSTQRRCTPARPAQPRRQGAPVSARPAADHHPGGQWSRRLRDQRSGHVTARSGSGCDLSTGVRLSSSAM